MLAGAMTVCRGDGPREGDDDTLGPLSRIRTSTHSDVSTTNETPSRLGPRAAAAGKHILWQKPLALTLPGRARPWGPNAENVASPWEPTIIFENAATHLAGA